MIEISQAGAIATITLPDCLALSVHDLAFGLELRDAIRDSADRDEIKAIVIRARGRDFSPAATPEALAAAAAGRKDTIWSSWHEAYAASSGLYQNICFCKKVVITAVDGICSGAGSLLVLCSDLTLATPDATFESPFGTLPEANLVLAALTMRLNRAKSWLLSGRPLHAQQAFDAGLINRIVEAKALDEAVQSMAHAVTRMPLDGIAMSKINVETCLDAQGVGREFDMAGFYAVTMQRCWDEAGAQSPGRIEAASK